MPNYILPNALQFLKVLQCVQYPRIVIYYDTEEMIFEVQGTCCMHKICIQPFSVQCDQAKLCQIFKNIQFLPLGAGLFMKRHFILLPYIHDIFKVMSRTNLKYNSVCPIIVSYDFKKRIMKQAYSYARHLKLLLVMWRNEIMRI